MSLPSLYLDVVLHQFGVNRAGLNPNTFCLHVGSTLSWLSCSIRSLGTSPCLYLHYLSACVPLVGLILRLSTWVAHPEIPICFINFNWRRWKLDQWFSSLGNLKQSQPNKLRPGLSIPGNPGSLIWTIVWAWAWNFFQCSLGTLR